jgi:hypothetical protein
VRHAVEEPGGLIEIGGERQVPLAPGRFAAREAIERFLRGVGRDRDRAVVGCDAGVLDLQKHVFPHNRSRDLDGNVEVGAEFIAVEGISCGDEIFHLDLARGAGTRRALGVHVHRAIRQSAQVQLELGDREEWIHRGQIDVGDL